MEIIEKIKRKMIGDADCHAQVRNKNIFKSIFTNVVARVVNIGSGLVTVPVTLKYLGTEQFAIWMAITSFVGFLTFADLGLGIGLQNALAQCFGKDDTKNPAHYISTTYSLLLAVALVLVAVSFFILPILPVEQLIKVEASESQSLILPTLQVFVTIFAIGLPAGVIERVLVGYQKAYIYGKLMVVGRLLGLLSVFVSISLGASLPVLTGLFVGIPVILKITYSIRYYKMNKWLQPSVGLIGREYLHEVAGTGLWSIFAQMSWVIKMNMPLLIISTTIGAVAVAQYSITQRLIGVAGTLIVIGLQPLWPAYGEAYHRGDKQWLIGTLKKSVKVVLVLSIPVFIILSFAGIPIIGLWTGENNIAPSFSLLMACNVWMILMSWNASFTMVLNGSNHLKGQAVYGLTLTILACVLAKFCGTHFGTAGVVWSIALIGEALFSVFILFEVKSVIKGMN